MASIPYVASSPWWSAANLNTLCGEFDRRLTLALAGKTPYLLGNYGIGDQTTPDHPFALPISQHSGDAEVDGCAYHDGVMGTVYVFTGSDADIIYFERTHEWDQGQMDTDAAAATESSRDATAKVMVVDDSAAAISLEWSLKAHTRDDAGTTFFLAPESVGGRRAMRRHRYAVAELVLEGLETFTVPRTWDRYANFRLHNLSAVEVTVTVETYNADGTDGTSETITLPKFGCQAFRRERGHYDDSYTYLWKARGGIDKRIYKPTGEWVVEASAYANNIANPNIIKDWLEKLGATRDPYIDPPDEGPRYTALFGDPSDTSLPVHDLIAHKGACRAIGWDAMDDPEEMAGTIGDSTTLVADLAAIGITVTVVGDTYELERDDATAPGEDANGLDLFAHGSNLLWLQAQTVSIPDESGFARGERQCQFTTLPVTLVEDVPIGALGNPFQTGYSSAGYSLATVSRTLYGDTSVYGIENKIGGSTYPGTGSTTTRLSEVGDSTADFDGPHVTYGDWQLTPLGWAVRWNYTFTFTTTISTGAEFEPLNGGIYERWSGSAVSRKAWIHLQPPGWSFGSIKPTRNRVYGVQAEDGGYWSTPDWSGILSDPDGKEPTATGKVLLEYTTLKYLSDIESEERGDVYDLTGVGSTPNNSTETRYAVRGDPDESKSVIDELVKTRRPQFNAGTPTVPAGTDPDIWFIRRPMQIEDYNSIAWMVNAWTRSVPLITIKNLWLMRTDEAGYTGLYIPEFTWEEEVFPKNAAFYFVPEALAAEWTKANWNSILTVSEREDMPQWAEAKAAYRQRNTFSYDLYRWLVDRYAGGDPNEIYGTRETEAVATLASSIKATGWTGSRWDHDDVDDDFGWVTTEEVAALATDKGLPYYHLTWGEAKRLMTRLPEDELPLPYGGPHFDDFGPVFVGTFTGGEDLTDAIEFTDSGSLQMPDGLAEFVAPEDADGFEYIQGGAYEVDSSGRPMNGFSPYHRGTPDMPDNKFQIYNSESGDPDVYIEPYYPEEDGIGLSEARVAVGVNMVLAGYSQSETNTRVMLGNEYTRELDEYNPMNGAETGGSWSYSDDVDMLAITTGFNFHLPTAIVERPCVMIANPYIDLQTETP